MRNDNKNREPITTDWHAMEGLVQGAIISALPGALEAFIRPAFRGGCVIPLVCFPADDETKKPGRTFEEIAAEAGQLIAASEDSSKKALKDTTKHQNDGASPATDKTSKDLEKQVRDALDQARRAKNAAYGAACSGKRAKDARKDIEDAEESFDQAEDDIDSGASKGKPADRNKDFKKAAEKIVNDLKKVKDAMDKILPV